MNPLWMILASSAGVVVMGALFLLQQSLRRRRVARRRALREARRYAPAPAPGAEREELTHRGVVER